MAAEMPYAKWQHFKECHYGNRRVSFMSAVLDGRNTYLHENLVDNHAWFDRVRKEEMRCPKPTRPGQSALEYRECIKKIYERNPHVKRDPDKELDRFLRVWCPDYRPTERPYTKPDTISERR
jgi:hypothetical protein